MKTNIVSNNLMCITTHNQLSWYLRTAKIGLIVTVRREPGWARIADVAIPLMEAIILSRYPPGGTVIRAMAAKLLSGGKISPHRDKHPSFSAAHRIHVPITTHPRVRFMIDGQPYQFKLGEAYEINNQRKHSVMNKSDEDRITFIFDYMPSTVLERVPESSG